MGEDKEEEEIKGAKGVEVEEAPTHAEPNKKKAKAQRVTKAKKKIVKPSLTKPKTSTTRATTRENQANRTRWPSAKETKKKIYCTT